MDGSEKKMTFSTACLVALRMARRTTPIMPKLIKMPLIPKARPMFSQTIFFGFSPYFNDFGSL